MKNIILNFIFLLFIYNLSFSQTEKSFDDNFDNNANQWPVYNDQYVSAKIENGKYYLKINTNNGSWKPATNIYINPNRDFTIESQITQSSGVNNQGFGISWGGKDDNNMYSFKIASSGYFQIQTVQNGNPIALNDWTQTDAINPLGKPNLLAIKKTGNIIRFFINSYQVYNTSFLKFMGLSSGFILSDKMEIEVENFTIYQDSVKINIIDKAINGYKKENLGKNINSEYSEILPIISADGKTLYISRYHPQNQFGANDCDIWYSNYENGAWQTVKNIGKPLNTYGGNSVISVSPDGNSLLLMNKYKSDGTIESGGISLAKKTFDGWSFPENINIDEFKNKNQYLNFCLSNDNKTLIMAIEGNDSYGDLDLYVSFKKDSGFSKPINLGNVLNTCGQDATPFLASDNVTLYFSSNGHKGYGGNDIYVTKRLDETWTNWSEPKNLGPEINTSDWDAYFILPASGEIAYIVSMKDAIGSADIFKIKVPESARPNPTVLISGKVLNKKTNEPISAEIRYFDLTSNKELGTAISNPKDGSYKIVLPYGKKYSFMAKKESYYAISDNLDVTNIKEYKEINRDLLLNPIEIGESIRLNNLFFDVDKAELNPESYGELDRLVEMLNKAPELQIGIYGHTDSDGNPNHNLQLSLSRAKSVSNYLISKGINSKRLQSKGFGKKKPLAQNDTEEGKAQNRRVEFIILKK